MKREKEQKNFIEALHYETGKPVRIEIVDGLISSINEIEGLEDDKKNLFVAPGLIDNQINGYAGVDFSGNKLSVRDVFKATQAIWKEGVTTFLPTVLTNSHDNLLKNLRTIDEAISGEEKLRQSIPGIHLEGPYISPEEGYRGCHPVQHIRKPSWKEFLAYQKAAGARIIQVTIAPETEGAMEFIRLCTRMGIVAALGHTNASSDQITQAVDSGARLSTHLGNGCANLIHRHQNPIWPQLANDLLTTSVIADGLHLTPDELKVFYKIKGPRNLILTSDVIYLAGMAPGRYTFLENEVILTDEGMLFNPELNCLAGASFPLKRGVENIMKFTGCQFGQAVNLASGNVASFYGFADRGELVRGKRADIILIEKKIDELRIINSWLNGKLVFDGFSE
jgi:N-acetylglucosamine-6-phosphate deacetylase